MGPIADEARRIVHALFPRLGSVPHLAAVVLFGSSVDGTFDKRSDVDLLFLFEGRANPERTSMQDVLAAIGAARKETGTQRDIAPVLATLSPDELDEDFRRNVAQGVVVWARPRLILGKPPRAGPHLLIHYGAQHLDASERGRLQRTLYGHRTRKTVKGKTYEHTRAGLVDKEERAAPGTLLVPQERSQEVLLALRKAGAKVDAKPVYLS